MIDRLFPTPPLGLGKIVSENDSPGLKSKARYSMEPIASCIALGAAHLSAPTLTARETLMFFLPCTFDPC
jgi:hypothetical protein